MTYFDASYIVKCYLNEPGTEQVQELAVASVSLSCSEWGRLEFFSALHRQHREGRMARKDVQLVLDRFRAEDQAAYWIWLPVTRSTLNEAANGLVRLPKNVFLRAGDALHLACAQENGFTEIYSNDHHLLAAARYFELKGVNVIDPL